MTSPILQVESITKSFGAVTAVSDVSFSVSEGEIVGLLGPNGSGKTTTMLMLLGMIKPTSGNVHIFGQDIQRHREEILGRMNFYAPYLAFPGRLTVYESLMVFAQLYLVAKPAAKIQELLAKFGLESLRDRPIIRLSSGETTRVGLCKALLNCPRLLLLDEPTAFLDPQVSRVVKQTLRELQQTQGMATLITTHNMADAEELCSRSLFLAKGRLVASGSSLEITRTLIDREREKPALAEVFQHVAGIVK